MLVDDAHEEKDETSNQALAHIVTELEIPLSSFELYFQFQALEQADEDCRGLTEGNTEEEKNMARAQIVLTSQIRIPILILRLGPCLPFLPHVYRFGNVTSMARVAKKNLSFTAHSCDLDTGLQNKGLQKLDPHPQLKP